jgi:hypothetical protein
MPKEALAENYGAISLDREICHGEPPKIGVQSISIVSFGPPTVSKFVPPNPYLPAPHSHSMIWSDDNALIYQCKFFPRADKIRRAIRQKSQLLI